MDIFEESELRLPIPNYDYITDEADTYKAMNFLSNYPIHSIDTETTGLDPYASKISLVQIGVNDKVFVFDVRHDTEHSSLHKDVLKPILTSKDHTRILQNALFDMKMVKHHMGVYIQNVYDTMLVEQLLNLGLVGVKSSLAALLLKYLGITMEKEPRLTFQDYNQKFKPFQLIYAARDVTPLQTIKDLQWARVKREKLEEVCQLEFDFLIPLVEMELNGILLDTDRWGLIMKEAEKDMVESGKAVKYILNESQDQSMLFNVSTINIDSNVQLKKALNKYGFSLENTSFSELEKHKGAPVIDALLDYRKTQKLISTYSDSLIAKISPYTGRLHTNFRQMVSTGRMSSSSPNLQNIPHDQKYRSCFIAKKGYSLITADMKSCELKIIGNLSDDPMFKDCFKNNVDLHTKSASEIFKVPMDKVDKKMRDSCKALSFGLMYGLSKFGLSKRLKITEKAAKELINNYFSVFKHVKKYLDESAQSALLLGYSKSISGRKRYYNKPENDNPDKNKILASIKRRAMNAPIQSGNADTLKRGCVYLYNRLIEKEYDAKILLNVHDEVVVEVVDEQKYEVKELVSQAIIDGFNNYFTEITMETDACIGPCWLKDGCSCGHLEMKFVPDKKYGTKLVCDKCGKDQ